MATGSGLRNGKFRACSPRLDNAVPSFTILAAGARARILPPGVGLFKRRMKTEELLGGHLERLGVSAVWLQSAKDAIRYCEKGEYFQPIFSVAGPAPARSVIALMRLEPFVQREIDWSVSPSESPFWVGFVGDVNEELFTETAKRFVDLYWSDRNPSVAQALEAALGAMVSDVVQSLSERSEDELDAKASRGIRALGSAGYVWRAAESGVQSGDLNLRADLAKEVDAVVSSFPETTPRDRLLARAASECVRRNLLFGSGSPGGWAAGGEFLRRGFRLTERHVVPEGTAIPHAERWYAFSFGIALYDVHGRVGRTPASKSRRSRR